jgi:hypothetical protein
MRFASVTAASFLWLAPLRAVMTILEKIGPEFERNTGHRLNVSSDIALNNVRRVMAGEPFDLLIASLPKWTT